MQQLKFSFLFIPLEFVFYLTLSFVKSNHIRSHCRKQHYTSNSKMDNFMSDNYLIFHLCFTITGLHIHVLTSALRRGTPEFGMYFFHYPLHFSKLLLHLHLSFFGNSISICISEVHQINVVCASVNPCMV